jgi:hypothetical protein
MRDLRYKKNGGSWQDITEENYDLSGTDLYVQLGEVEKNDSYRIIANGSAITSNGDFTITEMTRPDEPLDSQIRVDSLPSSGQFHLEVSGSLYGDRVHYAYSESWSETDEYTRFGKNGSNRVVLPDAEAEGLAFFKTYPVKANPSNGDVLIAEPGSSRTQPEFYVIGGSATSVDYSFTTPVEGSTYVLQSRTFGVVRGSETADGSVTIEDDTSEERLQFRVDNGTASSSSSPSGGGGFFSDASNGVSQTVDDVARTTPVFQLLDDSAIQGPAFLLAGLVGLALVVVAGGLVLVRSDGPIWSVTINDDGDDGGRRSRSAEASSPGVVSRFARAIGNAATNRYVIGIAGLGAALIGIQMGVLFLPPRTLFVIVMALVPVGLYLGLQRLDMFSWRIFAVSTGLLAGGALFTLAPSLSRIPPGTGTVVLLGALLLGGYLGLQRLRLFSWPVFLLASVVVGVLGIELVAPGSLGTIASNIDSNVLVIGVMAVAGLAGYWLYSRNRAASTPDEVNNIVLGGAVDDSSSSQDTGGGSGD